MPIYEKAEQLGLPVVFHTGNYRANATDRLDRRPMARNMHPLTLDRIARSFPDLRIVIAHLGTWLFRREAAGMARLHPNVFFDLAGTGSYQALSAEELQGLLRNPLAPASEALGGFSKMVLGSDAYVSRPQLMSHAQIHYQRLMADIGLPEAIQTQVTGRTVGCWLNLESA